MHRVERIAGDEGASRADPPQSVLKQIGSLLMAAGFAGVVGMADVCHQSHTWISSLSTMASPASDP
jgi:hypothetical protein